MEFPGVGTLCLDTPPLNLKPFMRRKLRVDSGKTSKKLFVIRRKMYLGELKESLKTV